MIDPMRPDDLDRLLSSHHGREPGNRPGGGLGLVMLIAVVIYVALIAAFVWRML
jgi:hypothetical protein